MADPTDDVLDPKKKVPINPPAPPMSEAAPGTGMSSAGPMMARPNIASGPPPLNAPPVGQVQSDQNEVNRLRTSGSGVDQYQKVHPIAGGILKGLSIAGSALLPGLSAQIPGTDTHHQVLENKAQSNLASDTAVQEKQAQTNEANARAGALANPKPDNPEQQFIDDFIKRNPDKNIGDAVAAYTDATNKSEPKTISDPKAGYSQAIADAIKNGSDPNTDPHVKAWKDAINNIAKQEKPDTPEQQYIDEYQKMHPGSTLAEALKNYAKDTQKPPVVNLNQSTARSDKSYQYNAGVLDKVGAPIEQAVQRMGRLRDTLAQGSPQADALVAPELLTVMAGGQGSGLRMNEAEISRIVGGRSKWENLKASVQQWSLDPSKANSITPDQRQQIHALVEHVNQKLLAKQKMLDDARNQLLGSDDPHEHRAIVAKTRQAMTQVDEGGETQPNRPANVPEGYVYQENGPKGKGWYKPNATK